MSTIMRKFYPHQKTASDYLSTNTFCSEKRGALYMQMRLGKTLTVIRHLEPQREEHKGTILILCPNSVKATWANEFEEEGIDDYLIVQGTKKQKIEAMQYDFNYVICNYESTKLINAHLYKWYAVILDESICIANPKSQRTKYILNSFRHIERKYILCGEPAPENELQYFNQMVFTFGSFMDCISYWDFREKYFTDRMYRWTPKPGIKAKLYKELRSRCYFLSRKEAKVGNVKLYKKIKVKATAAQKKAYNEMFEEFEADGVSTKYAPVKALYLHKIAGGVNLDLKSWHSLKKFEAIIEMLQTELKNEKVIIWFAFIHEIEKMRELLSKANLSHVYIDGSVSVELRERYRRLFTGSQLINISIMSIGSMYRGTNWSAASTEIYYSNDPSRDKRSQSEDRLIGFDTEPKQVIDVCTDGTIDLDYLELLRGKKIDSEFFKSSLYGAILKRGMI